MPGIEVATTITFVDSLKGRRGRVVLGFDSVLVPEYEIQDNYSSAFNMSFVLSKTAVATEVCEQNFRAHTGLEFRESAQQYLITIERYILEPLSVSIPLRHFGGNGAL